jgi:hypothetical protein
MSCDCRHTTTLSYSQKAGGEVWLGVTATSRAAGLVYEAKSRDPRQSSEEQRFG